MPSFVFTLLYIIFSFFSLSYKIFCQSFLSLFSSLLFNNPLLLKLLSFFPVFVYFKFSRFFFIWVLFFFWLQ